MTSICTDLVYLIKDIFWFLTKSLSIKQAEALESNKIKTLWFLGPKHTSIIKQCEGSEEKIRSLLEIIYDFICTVPIVGEKTWFLIYYLLWQSYSLFVITLFFLDNIEQYS